MFKNFKTLGGALASIFSANPTITEEEKTSLEAALNADAEALKTEALADAQTQITDLQGKLQAAVDADAAKAAQVTELETKLTALQGADTKLAELQKEYDALETEVEEFRAKVHGKKAGEKKQAGDGEEGETLAEEIDRLKAEHPYSMKGLDI